MSDYPMLISNKLHSFRNFALQNYQKKQSARENSQKYSSRMPMECLGVLLML